MDQLNIFITPGKRPARQLTQTFSNDFCDDLISLFPEIESNVDRSRAVEALFYPTLKEAIDLKKQGKLSVIKKSEEQKYI